MPTNSPIGMSVPGASELGLSLDGETEDERRRKLLAQQQQRLLPNSSVGASSLFGYGMAGATGGR